MASDLKIRNAEAVDATTIVRIYNHYVTDSIVTFEQEIVSDDEMVWRISDVQNQGLPWIVFVEQNEILGFAYAGPWRKRIGYRFVVESSVYVDVNRMGQGIGLQLYTHLLDELKSKQIHAAMGCIALPNEASVKLHEKMGFKKAGHFQEVGFKFGRWIDVGYWQLMLTP